MEVRIKHSCKDFTSFRAEKVKSLFNAESGHTWEHIANIPTEDDDWQIGMIVGPSGSGKTSIGRSIWEDVRIYDPAEGWPEDAPIIDHIAPDKDLSIATAALGGVGLGDVPSWLRPFKVLSNGEQFRAGLAKIICDAPEKCIIDEFTSVVDRQIAQIGAGAFSKAWRRNKGSKVVLLSCHYDVIDWVQPDWVYDTREGVLVKKPLNAPSLNYKFGRQTEVTGNFLKSIII